MLSILTFRTPEEAVEKANNTPYGLSAGIWTEKGSRILWMAERMKAGVVWANTFNRFDPTSPFGGYKESGFGREGGLHGLEPYLELDGGATMSEDRRPVRRTAKLFIGGRVPPQRVRPLLRGGRARRPAARARRASLAQGPARRGRAARAAQPGWAGKTAYNRGQILYRVAELMEGRRAQFESELADAGAQDPRAGVDAVDRPMGLVRGVGRQDRPAPRGDEPGRRARTSTSRSPSRRAWWGSSRRGSSRCSASSRGSRPAIVCGQHGGRARERAVPAARGVARRGARDLATSRAAS